MAEYKLVLDEGGEVAGVKWTRPRDGVVLSVPNSDDNRHWRKYQEWLAEGNTPDPAFTPEELSDMAIQNEIADLINDLKKVIASQFEMILAMFDVGKANGAWANTDFPQELRTKAASWKQKIDRLRELES
jgi:hypothetical protein